MAVAAPVCPRVSVGGKFFWLDGRKFYVKGLTYGPFAPNAAGQPFASPEQTARDFAQIRELGGNLIRVYHVPARWFLDLADEHRLKVLVDIPWNKHLCFLDSAAEQAAAREAVRQAVTGCGGHRAVLAFSVANEIPADIVRWSGAHAVAAFIDELVHEAKRLDPDCLCTFTNFPPTEFLRPRAVDFVCFNVYLHEEPAFRSYLARLQLLSEGKPLLLGEFGIDSLREGEPRKCQILGWAIEDSFRAGLAGAILFSYTDDWWRGGQVITDWALGLTTRERQPKPSFAAVQQAFRLAPYYLLPRYPKVSVVVCAYNADRTLPACLDSLQRLDYPDYEVILVDDGSTDSTPQLAVRYPKVHWLRFEQNGGLSAARNAGISAATGEIVAYTDADCRVDEDWLYYLVAGLLDSGFAGVGGPNLLPLEDSAVAAAVMVSPGGPAHVMLTDREAEHIPGCNMAFFRAVLVELGGFDPVFRQAGDDVDLCWRLQQAGWKLGFCPAAFVWHYRRSTVRDYLKQQRGYGEAEALLVRKHPEYFNPLGGGVWRGRIYASSKLGVLVRPSMIYRGLFGSAGYQALYAAVPDSTLMLCTTLEYHLLVELPLWVLTVVAPYLLPLAITASLVPVAVCVAAGVQADLPREKLRPWSRALVGLLFFLQPIVRGWARHRGRLLPRAIPPAAQPTLDSVALQESQRSLDGVDYWSDCPLERLAWVTAILQRLEKRGWPHKGDIGWSDFDVEIYDRRWSHLQLITVAEDHGGGKVLLRCHLRSRWSLPAQVVFWLLTALELLVLGAGARNLPWLWSMLLTLPLVAAILHRQERKLQSLVLVFLDELAKEWGLTKLKS